MSAFSLVEELCSRLLDNLKISEGSFQQDVVALVHEVSNWHDVKNYSLILFWNLSSADLSFPSVVSLSITKSG